MKQHSRYLALSLLALAATSCVNKPFASGDAPAAVPATTSVDSIYDPGYGPYNEYGDYLPDEADATAYQKRQPGMVGSSSSGNSSSSSSDVKTVYAVQQPTPVVSTPSYSTSSSYRSHTVSKGDTLYSISRKYGTTVAKIQQTNGLSGSLIRIGDTLRIPR